MGPRPVLNAWNRRDIDQKSGTLAHVTISDFLESRCAFLRLGYVLRPDVVWILFETYTTPTKLAECAVEIIPGRASMIPWPKV